MQLLTWDGIQRQPSTSEIPFALFSVTFHNLWRNNNFYIFCSHSSPDKTKARPSPPSVQRRPLPSARWAQTHPTPLGSQLDLVKHAETTAIPSRNPVEQPQWVRDPQLTGFPVKEARTRLWKKLWVRSTRPFLRIRKVSEKTWDFFHWLTILCLITGLGHQIWFTFSISN